MPDLDRTIYQCLSLPGDYKSSTSQRLGNIPPPPPWRNFTESKAQQRGSCFEPDSELRERIAAVVNAAICLRRPILVEGSPGTGKTTLAYAIALELGLPGPFRWSITSRSSLKEGLYDYDAVGRLHDANRVKSDTDTTQIGVYMKLGPLGLAFKFSEKLTASSPAKPAVLLIDEIDKADIDLPNDLLHVFEEGSFEIPELRRVKLTSGKATTTLQPWGEHPVSVTDGTLRCEEFPLILMTSNGEREFPAPFLRRCLRLRLDVPSTAAGLRAVITARFGPALAGQEQAVERIVQKYLEEIKPLEGKAQRHAVDQLLNAMHLLMGGTDVSSEQHSALWNIIFADLTD